MKKMVKSAVWDTYAVGDYTLSSEAYLMEKGLTTQYTGKSMCEGKGYSDCNDNIKRTISWTGLVGLMSVSDVIYADGWLYNGKLYPWLITPRAATDRGRDVKLTSNASILNWGTGANFGVWPSLYLKSNVTFIDEGNGTEESPYILGINE